MSVGGIDEEFEEFRAGKSDVKTTVDGKVIEGPNNSLIQEGIGRVLNEHHEIAVALENTVLHSTWRIWNMRNRFAPPGRFQDFRFKFSYHALFAIAIMQRVVYLPSLPVLNSDLILPCRKPKTARTKRIFEKRSPKLVENPKQAVLVRGSTASAQTQSILADLVCSPSKQSNSKSSS
jgi:hypothetical protein